MERKRKVAAVQPTDLGDDTLRAAARYTDGLPLANYDGILHLVPRLVNIVTLAEAIPVPGRRALSAAGALRVAAAEMPAEALALPVTEAVHHDELAVYALESRRAGPLQRMIW